jgi:hypothetical protein
VLTMRAISTCILKLKEEVEQHRKAKEAEAKLKEAQACQLEYLKAVTESLTDTFKRRSTVGVAEAYKEMVLSLDKFNAGLLDTTARGRQPPHLQESEPTEQTVSVEMYLAKWHSSWKRWGQARAETSWDR